MSRRHARIGGDHRDHVSSAPNCISPTHEQEVRPRHGGSHLVGILDRPEQRIAVSRQQVGVPHPDVMLALVRDFYLGSEGFASNS